MSHHKKLLLIMRHAKSDKTSVVSKDIDRPLNERGQEQPKLIADQLNSRKISIERALVSPSRRTKETFSLLKEHLRQSPEPIFEPRLYNASPNDFIDVLSENANRCDSLLVVAHCPAVIEVTEFLTGEYHDFKTASLAILSAKYQDLKTSLLKPGQFNFEEMLVVADEIE